MGHQKPGILFQRPAWPTSKDWHVIWHPRENKTRLWHSKAPFIRPTSIQKSVYPSRYGTRLDFRAMRQASRSTTMMRTGTLPRLAPTASRTNVHPTHYFSLGVCMYSMYETEWLSPTESSHSLLLLAILRGRLVSKPDQTFHTPRKSNL